ncbi:MAG: hypothetical protein JXN64_08020 [Spirochaetes bacterium]|nr:hypothetical protein [Spirochaetota bacterium]
MKTKRLLALILFLSAILLTACASSDTTNVTVYFSKGGHASLEQEKLPLIDRIFNFFAKPAYAQYSPGDTEYYSLLVVAEDMDLRYTTAPGTASSVSIEVPNGDNRIFGLYSISPDSEINYVGQNVVNLSGGDVSFSLTMYPSFNDVYAISDTEQNFISITWDADATLIAFSDIEIYRACLGTSCDGTFGTTPLTILAIESESYEDSLDLIPGNEYFYYLRIPTPGFGGGGRPIPVSIEDYYSDINYLFVFDEGMTEVQYIYGLF